jgi:methylated-DNA-[protein]-cysteine S-methyltransferase
MHFVDRLQTPIGELFLTADERGALRSVGWSVDEMHAYEVRRNPFGFTDAMAAYFSGELAAIDGLPVAAEGTEFQRAVWAALRTIRHGVTISYGELARRIGRPAAVRAVGLANGANPVGIVVPCHRVIGADGTLTGYGGGLERKRWLLAHEGASANLSLDL